MAASSQLDIQLIEYRSSFVATKVHFLDNGEITVMIISV